MKGHFPGRFAASAVGLHFLTADAGTRPLPGGTCVQCTAGLISGRDCQPADLHEEEQGVRQHLRVCGHTCAKLM